MTPAELHARAHQVFADVLAHATPDDAERPTSCDQWTVADLIDHVIGGNRWVVETLGGVPQELPAGDWSTTHAATAAQAQASFEADGAMEQMVELPFGTIPGAAFASIRAGDAFTHAWDLAKALGLSTDLDPEVATAVRANTEAFLSPALRGEGRPFGAEQPCPPDAPPADHLAALLGRSIN